jgi:hypothetical protein
MGNEADVELKYSTERGLVAGQALFEEYVRDTGNWP